MAAHYELMKPLRGNGFVARLAFRIEGVAAHYELMNQVAAPFLGSLLSCVLQPLRGNGFVAAYVELTIRWLRLHLS